MRRIARLSILLTLVACSGTAISTAQPSTPPAAAETAKAAKPDYVRVVDDEAGGKSRLELAIRSFQRADGSGPTVHLVSAVHIADSSFYATMQEFLDKQDVVLFEGVKPPGAGRIGAAATDEQKAKGTLGRLKLLSSLVQRYWADNGSPPESMEDLAKGDKRFGTMVPELLKDGWGHAAVYTVAKNTDGETTYTIVSPGSDGAAGGEGFAADITVSGGAPKAGENSKGKGIQQQLAKALGLTFQLDAMVSSKKNWRSSDLSIDQIQERMDAAGADAKALFSMLDGSSFTGQLAGLLLGLIGQSPTMSAMAKVLMVETLGASEKLLGSDGEAPATGPMAKMAPMMKVIIKDRNEVVLNDIKDIIAREPNVKSIAAFYGAGHMGAMEKSLTTDLGMVLKGENWYPAIEVDGKAAGLSAKQMKAMRAQMQGVMESQSGAKKNKPKKEPKEDAPADK